MTSRLRGRARATEEACQVEMKHELLGVVRSLLDAALERARRHLDRRLIVREDSFVRASHERIERGHVRRPQREQALPGFVVVARRQGPGEEHGKPLERAMRDDPGRISIGHEGEGVGELRRRSRAAREPLRHPEGRDVARSSREQGFGGPAVGHIEDAHRCGQR